MSAVIRLLQRKLDEERRYQTSREAILEQAREDLAARQQDVTRGTAFMAELEASITTLEKASAEGAVD